MPFCGLKRSDDFRATKNPAKPQHQEGRDHRKEYDVYELKATVHNWLWPENHRNEPWWTLRHPWVKHIVSYLVTLTAYDAQVHKTRPADLITRPFTG